MGKEESRRNVGHDIDLSKYKCSICGQPVTYYAIRDFRAFLCATHYEQLWKRYVGRYTHTTEREEQ